MTLKNPRPSDLVGPFFVILSDLFDTLAQKIEVLDRNFQDLKSQVQKIEDREKHLNYLEDEMSELRWRVDWDSPDNDSVEDTLQREYAAERRGEEARE